MTRVGQFSYMMDGQARGLDLRMDQKLFQGFIYRVVENRFEISTLYNDFFSFFALVEGIVKPLLDPHPDPLVRGRIRVSGSTQIFHGSGTLD